MKYYTKEWYDLMQHMDYTGELRSVPDNDYSGEAFKLLYEKELKKEVARARKSYNAPPSFGGEYALLEPDIFDPELFLIENEETGELFHPDTPDAARAYMDEEYRKAQKEYEMRPSFDAKETIAFFEEVYITKLQWGYAWLPEWVVNAVDKRLLALDCLPASVYRQLRKEEQKNRRAFDRIMKKAEEDLNRQDIPEDLKEAFCLHDSHLLSLKKVGSDVVMCLRKDGAWLDGMLYIRVDFKKVSLFEKEKGLTIRKKVGPYGDWESNCVYLYNELYRTDTGYEIHMLLWVGGNLRYVTIGCEDVVFEATIGPEDI